MYERILVAIDAAPDSPDDSLQRTIQFAKMTGGTVHLLHFARGHVVAYDINAGAGLGVLEGEDDVPTDEQRVVQDAVDLLAAAGVAVHGELVNATEHDIPDIILQRAHELPADIIVLGYQYHRGSTVAEQVIRRHPECSVLLARPPQPA
ncbi:universal stress protein [Rhodococcus sp. GXMU-t2271]|uniref:universal stress protein n=1 Tax=Rhodococcus sp. GXMU-t2271 TaxID=3059079 RepID=UPI00352B0B3A